MSDNFLKDLIKDTKNEYASIVEDGIIGDTGDYFDTGSYILNAQISGSLYGGYTNRINILAGPSAVGKTFLLLSSIRSFLNESPNNFVTLFESEAAITADQMAKAGVDLKRVVVFPVTTVQEFRTQAMKVLSSYEEKYGVDNPKAPGLMLCLDSLGNLSTEKEVSDITEGKDTRDMTRAQLIRGTFRVLTLKLGKLNIPAVITNHTYETMGLFSETAMGGGQGAFYSATNVIFLTKAKAKDGTEVVGGIITSHLKKGRLSRENTKVKMKIDYTTGLNRYYGLQDLGLKAGVIEKLGNKLKFPNGDSAFEKAVFKNPEKYFTQDVMQELEVAAQKHYRYGNDDGNTETTEDE